MARRRDDRRGHLWDVLGILILIVMFDAVSLLGLRLGRS